MSDETLCAAVFPGQGSQRPGMGDVWRGTHSWSIVETVSESTGTDVAELLTTADEDRLRRTDNAQLAIFTVGLMAYREASAAVGGTIVAYAGHSLGEYVALVAAGALDLQSAARLVGLRGAAMARASGAVPASMVVLINTSETMTDDFISACRTSGHRLWVANVNTPSQVVLSGAAEAIEFVLEHAMEFGMKAIRLRVGGAFHSPLMEAAAAELASPIAATPFAQLHRPVVSNVDGVSYRSGAVWPGLMVQQVTHTVRWVECVRTLVHELGCTRIVEFGPGKTLTGLASRIVPGIELVNVLEPATYAAESSRPSR